MPARIALAAAFAWAAFASPLVAAPPPAPAAGCRIDLDTFTVDGVGLLSSAAEVRAALGAPEEEQRISGVTTEEERERQRAAAGDEEGEDPDVRLPLKRQARIVHAYFAKGIRVVFLAETMRIESIDLYIRALPPYARFTGSFVQPFPVDVREADLLRPLARQIYKDTPVSLSLKKDDATPKRETALLSFGVEGWLTRVTFSWEENLEIDFDRLSVAGISPGDPVSLVLERLGPPDRHAVRAKQMIGRWEREGLRIHAGQDDGRVCRIVVALARFDGGSAQGFPLAQRKDAYRAHLKDRIYQESSARICAYRAGEPLSPQKLILNFDESDRLKSAVLDVAPNIAVDLASFAIGGIRVGDPARKVRKTLGSPKKWRRAGRQLILGYPVEGIRVHLEDRAEGEPGRKAPGFSWGTLGEVKRVEAVLETSPRLYGTPFSFGSPAAAWEKEASAKCFSRKGDTLYLSPDGKPPARGVAALIAFEKVGWPHAAMLREFSDVAIDMKRFSVHGVTLGTHADEVLRLLGRPERARVLEKQHLEVLRYIAKGLVVVIDRMNRGVCKITVRMDRFEGSFVQDLAPDSNADEFEKAVYAQIYTQDEKRLCLSRDGKPPVWEEGIVNFGLSGEVDTIVFQTLGIKKEGILLDITRELE